ncbi:hypothetical protein J6590_058306 [Homalodisca vitripennis]|nr:hypothetical protein J6590_058306 [Homalodisca vitripennis]
MKKEAKFPDLKTKNKTAPIQITEAHMADVIEQYQHDNKGMFAKPAKVNDDLEADDIDPEPYQLDAQMSHFPTAIVEESQSPADIQETSKKSSQSPAAPAADHLTPSAIAAARAAGQLTAQTSRQIEQVTVAPGDLSYSEVVKQSNGECGRVSAVLETMISSCGAARSSFSTLNLILQTTTPIK